MNKENNTQQQTTLEIKKAYTFFFVPFYYQGTQFNNFTHNRTWKLEDEKLSNEGEDGDVLYAYIMKFLQGQMYENNSDKDHLDIYRLSVDKNTDWYKNFWSPFVNYSNVAKISMGKNEKKEEIIHSVKFQLLSGDEKGFKAPHLFIYKKAQIGILSFCIELAEKKNTISDLKLLNYHLHKIHQPMCQLVCPQLSINSKRVFSSESERLFEEKKLCQARMEIASFNPEKTYSPYGEFTWNMRGLVDMWLQNIEFTLFSNIRMHVFTYCQIDDSENEVLTKDQLLPDLLRLSRCVNDKYQLPFSDLECDGATLQSFDNIYMASSVEGTAIIAVAKKANKGFVSQMDGIVKLRYIWVYLLVIVQRYTLLNMNRHLMEVEASNNEDALWDVMKTIKNVKIRCYYTDVSPYTQHSQFYQLCCKNLHVKDAFNEIDQKTKALNLVINHDVQKLLEAQKKELEQQRINEEKREKQQLEAVQKAERKAENGQRRLNLVVGVLTVFQVAGVINDFLNDKLWWKWLAISFTFGICFFFLFLVMNWDKKEWGIIRFARKTYYLGNEPDEAGIDQ